MERYSINSDGSAWLLWRDNTNEVLGKFQDRQEALRTGMRLAHRNGSYLLLSPHHAPRVRNRPSAAAS